MKIIAHSNSGSCQKWRLPLSVRCDNCCPKPSGYTISRLSVAYLSEREIPEVRAYVGLRELLVWGGRWDSNPRSSVPQTDALGQLRYTHHILARLKGLEPLDPCLEGRCSIQLSYRRLLIPQGRNQMERVMGIEPTRPAWKAGVLPLNYTRRWAVLTALSIIPQGLRNVKTIFRTFENFGRPGKA